MTVGRRNAALNRLSPVFVQGFIGATSENDVTFTTESHGEICTQRIAIPIF